MSPDEVFQVLTDDTIGYSRFEPYLSQLLVGSLQLLDLLLQRLNLPLLVKVHQTPMIDLMLNNLSLSFKYRTGVLMIRDLWRTPIVKIAIDWIRYKVKRVGLGVVTLVVERSQGLDPWTDGSEGLFQLMTWSQNPRTVGVRTFQMKGVGEPLRTPSTMTRRGRGTIDRGRKNPPRRRSRTIERRHGSLFKRHF